MDSNRFLSHNLGQTDNRLTTERRARNNYETHTGEIWDDKEKESTSECISDEE